MSARDLPLQLDGPAGRRELASVRQQIDDDLLHLFTIRENGERRISRSMRVADALLGELWNDERLAAAQCFLDRNLRHRQLDVAALEFREIEDHVDERHQVLLRLMDAIDILALVFVQSAVDVLLQYLEVAGHRVQRSAKLVT